MNIISEMQLKVYSEKKRKKFSINKVCKFNMIVEFAQPITGRNNDISVVNYVEEKVVLYMECAVLGWIRNGRNINVRFFNF
jgi:hypothetical protein